MLELLVIYTGQHVLKESSLVHYNARNINCYCQRFYSVTTFFLQSY